MRVQQPRPFRQADQQVPTQTLDGRFPPKTGGMGGVAGRLLCAKPLCERGKITCQRRQLLTFGGQQRPFGGGRSQGRGQHR